MTADEILRSLVTRERSCRDVTAGALTRIDAGRALGAWIAVDEAGALAQAEALDRRGPEGLPLFGLPVGVKDVFDTADLPTAYGSPAYAGHRPEADAAVVAALRRAGAIVVGKTTSTEFAALGPTAVGNPAAPGRSPGGSSSGSAAAVAAGMVPVALGTQTAGSIVRPAAYCAVTGYKPTFGTFSREGVLPVSATLDTVGLIAATPADAALVARVLVSGGGRTPTDRRTVPVPFGDGASPADPPPSVAFARTPFWDRIEPGARTAMTTAVAGLPSAGAVSLPDAFAAVTRAQETIQLVETAQALARDRAVLSDALRDAVDEGLAVAPATYWAARAAVEEHGGACRRVVEDAGLLLMPATTGVPPHLPSTGDPLLCRAWTALGLPCVTVPLARDAAGLPVGLQLVAPRGEDARLLAAAQALIEVASL